MAESEIGLTGLPVAKLSLKTGDFVVVSLPPEQMLSDLATTARWFQQLVPDGVRVLVIPDTMTIEAVPRERLMALLGVEQPALPTAGLVDAKREHLRLVTRDDVERHER